MKGFLKKLSATAVAGVMVLPLCLGLFAGCGSDAAFSAFIFSSATDQETNRTLINAWADRYAEENGLEPFTVDLSYQSKTEQYFSDVANDIAAGTVADIFYVAPKQVRSYASAGTVLDLTSYVDWEKYGYGNDVWETAMGMYATDADRTVMGETIKFDTASGTWKTVDDNTAVGIYALPKDHSSFGLAYNKNFFSSTLKRKYTTTTTAGHGDAAFYVDSNGNKGEAAPFISIGRTVRYYPFNFYNYDSYTAAYNAGDPIARLADHNGGYDVTILGWPGDTYDTGVTDDPDTEYDESIGYVTYTYAEYSALTFAICYYSEIVDRGADGKHTDMKWLNDSYYSGYNYVYGNDQYESTLYLTAWLLGNDADVISDDYKSVDARYQFTGYNESGEAQYASTGATDSDNDGLYDSDYGINSEKFVEAYAAFLAYGSDWNNNAYYSGNKAESYTNRDGMAAMQSGRQVFYGCGTWDLQTFNSTPIDRLQVGLMPEPVSESYSPYARVKNSEYVSQKYSNSTKNTSGNPITDSSLNVYDENGTLNTSAAGYSAWKAYQDERQDVWQARLDTVGYGVYSGVIDRYGADSWKIKAIADLCAFLTMGEDIQLAYTYSGSQVTSLKSQSRDYVWYQTANNAELNGGSFANMLTPDGNAQDSLTVTSAELDKVNTYYQGRAEYMAEPITLSGTTLTGKDIWYFAVGAANVMYDSVANQSAADYITANFPSLVPYLNTYFKSLNIKNDITTVSMAFKALNMVAFDKAERNLQIRMAAGVNGKSDSATFTYSDTWMTTTFNTTFKGYALIAYLRDKDEGGESIVQYDAKYDSSTGVYFAVGRLDRIDPGEWDAKNQTATGWSGKFYTPTAYCVSVVVSVQNELRINAVNAEYTAMNR